MEMSDMFQVFCSNLRIPQSTVQQVDRIYKQLTSHLNLTYYGIDSNTKHSAYLGSYGRGTAIKVDDIDVVFALPPALFQEFNQQDNPALTMRNNFMQVVKSVFPEAYLGNDNQVIRLDFEEGISFEVFPGFLNQNGSYTMADNSGNGSWLVCDPKPEIETIKEANINIANDNLTRLSRMIKEWKTVWNVPIGGFLIDTLVYDFFINWEHKENASTYYDWMVRDFFEFLMDQDITQKFWLSPGRMQKVWRKGLFEEKAHVAYNLSNQALELEFEELVNNSKISEKWQEIFGARFSGSLG